MLVREGAERTTGADIALASIFAGNAGALNAAGFQATGVFSANMTGNASALSDHIGLGQFGLGGFFLLLVLAFIAGAFVSGLLIEAGSRRGVKAIYAYSITVEAALLVVLGTTMLMSPPNASLLVLGLSFIMGLQNAVTTRISGARVRTTHISGLATDVGLLIAKAITQPQRNRATGVALQLFGSTILAFFIGGVIGVLL